MNTIVTIKVNENFLKRSESKKIIKTPKLVEINIIKIKRAIHFIIKIFSIWKTFPREKINGKDMMDVAHEEKKLLSINFDKNINSIFIGVENRNSSSGVLKNVEIEVIIELVKRRKNIVENNMELIL